MTAETRPLIILVTSGYHLYREYLLKLVAGAARVWLLADAEPEWERPYIAGHTVVDTLDPAAMIEAARAVSAGTPVQGVLCWDEVRMVQSAQVAQALGLPGGDPEVLGRCRDKHQTREALAAAGVPQASSTLVTSVTEARAAADRIGYPVIVKPRALGASIGVSGVDGPDQVEAAYQHARGATEDGVPYYEEWVLVEEYLDGPEISVDAACADGELSPLFVARKISGFPPHFEEIGHTVDAADPLLTDAGLLDVLFAAHQAVGFRNGMTHTELRLTASGPKVVEINCRLGGDLIPYVGYTASGIDPGRVAVQVTCGVRPDVTPTRKRVAAVQFFYPDRDVIVAEVTADPSGLPPTVDTLGVLAFPGQRLELPPAGHVACRYAYAVAAADTVEDCMAATQAAHKAVSLRVRDGS
jgi:biotin carboxylase